MAFSLLLALRHRLEVVQELPLRHSASEGAINCDVGHVAHGHTSDSHFALDVLTPPMLLTVMEVDSFIALARAAKRWWAIRALRITNSPDAVDAIITALRDKDPEIRAHAATSLTELTGHSVTNAKQPSLTPIQLENAWLAWWHDHRQGTKINEYPGEICRMN